MGGSSIASRARSAEDRDEGLREMTIDEAFDKTSRYYDEWVRQAIPCYDEAFSTALELIPFGRDEGIRVLDLGAGTGLFSQYVFGKYPNASFVLYDVATEMLEVARERFEAASERFEFIVDDYRSIRDDDAFELVISSLSIHHLEDADKRKLFGRMRRALTERGMFINVDQIKGETEALQQLYWSTWLAKVRASGAEEERIQSAIRRRRRYDRDASLQDQLQWLREAGFVHADCVYKSYFIGVFLATNR